LYIPGRIFFYRVRRETYPQQAGITAALFFLMPSEDQHEPGSANP